MNVSEVWKRLRKRLKRKKRILSLASWFLLAVVLALVTARQTGGGGAAQPAELPVESAKAVDPGAAAADRPAMTEERLSGLLKNGPAFRSVVLHRQYVCGEEVRELGRMSRDGILRQFREHADWTVSVEGDGSVSFRERINDLSPACKTSAYFGLDRAGNLTLFDGLPKDDKVIRTFFQLNIAHLKSRLPDSIVQSLYDGIRIRDMAEFNSVLSTFSEFAAKPSKA